jgi:sRNA-binding protein
VLLQLADLYPALFGEVALPLKRGVFQDLMAAHPEVFDKATLKEALGQHTRSTRYLKAMSDGLPRHDLQGQPVEALALEHAYHALLEVFKRRHARTGEDVRVGLQTRMLQMLDASDMHRDDFARHVRTKDEAANALLDAVLTHANERAAKDEALLRAHTGSGLSVEDFASSYGMDAATVAQSLARAALVPLPLPLPLPTSKSVEAPLSAPSAPTETETPSAEADAAGSN